ncbi:MAG: hypothetical protein AB7F75_10145 [Planctomycetota bacterium]
MSQERPRHPLPTRWWLATCLIFSICGTVFWFELKPYDARSQTPPSWRWIHDVAMDNPWVAPLPSSHNDFISTQESHEPSWVVVDKNFARQFDFTFTIPSHQGDIPFTEAIPHDSQHVALIYGARGTIRHYMMMDTGDDSEPRLEKLGHELGWVWRQEDVAHALVGDVTTEMLP